VTIWALYAAIAMPVIYFGTQLVAAPFYPMAVFAPIPSESETTAMIAGSWRAEAQITFKILDEHNRSHLSLSLLL
jgi:hypothetical protein